VTQRHSPIVNVAQSAKPPWSIIDGSEQVILGDLSILTEGAAVNEETTKEATTVATATEPK
jgi:hypothetical protein